jgi:LCP family protein required for cell wall assembly
MAKNHTIDGLKVRNTKAVAPAPSIDGIGTKKKASRVVSSKNTVSLEVSKSTPAKSVEKTAIKKVAPKKVASKKVASKPVEQPKKTVSVDDFLAPVGTFDFDSESGQLKESDEPIKKQAYDELDKKTAKKMQKQAKKNHRLKKKKSKVKTIIVTIILLIIVVALAGGLWLCLWGNDIIMKITGGKSDLFSAIGVLTSDTYEPLKMDENGRTNILIFGTSGYNMEGDEGFGVHDGAQLADSIMAFSVDQNAGDIAMISLPRDLKAPTACTGTGKINETYWCHNQSGDNEQAGAQALMNDVSDILGLDFQYFVHVNWGSLVQIVDILGGITITLDEGIYDYDWTGAVYDPGVAYTIDGAEALGVARARHGTVGGDFSRGNNQQKLLIAIKERIYEKNLSLTDMMSLAGTLGDNLRSSLSLEEIKTAAHLTFDFDFNSIRQIPLVDYDEGIYYFKTANINNISYVIPSAGVGNYYAINNYVAENIKTPLPPEPEAPEEDVEAGAEIDELDPEGAEE